MLLLSHLKSSNQSFSFSSNLFPLWLLHFIHPPPCPPLRLLKNLQICFPGPFQFLLQPQLNWTSDASPALDWGTTSDRTSHSGACGNARGCVPLAKRCLQGSPRVAFRGGGLCSSFRFSQPPSVPSNGPFRVFFIQNYCSAPVEETAASEWGPFP